MSLPVQIVPGDTHMVTRRCLDGTFFCVPDTPEVKQLFEFLLGHYARKYRVVLHSWVLMSNHAHVLLTDPDGVVPLFEQALFGTLSRALNTIRARVGTVFEQGTKKSRVKCPTVQESIERAAYLHANPTRAGLVASHGLWPGAISSPASCLEGPSEVERPDIPLFSKRTLFPKTATLEAHADPRAASPEAWAKDVQARTADLEWQATVALKKARKRSRGRAARRRPLFLGAAACMRLRWDQKPRKSQLRERHGINPMFSGPVAVVQELVARYHQFVDAYREALQRFRDGDRDVVFPFGTFAMAQRYRVNVAAAPS